MLRCAACSSEAFPGSRYCSACGAAIGEPTLDPTRTTTPHARTTASASGSAASPVRFLTGSILAGRYRIVAALGAGGMGEVYRAEDLKLGQTVALKFLPVAVERDPTRLARLLSEVRTARQITHPNVCRVHDIAEADGHHFISMEYVDGEDLSSLLTRIGHLPKDKALQVARQLCAGLAAAHEQGILHRDLKPSNVMLDGRGRVRITDFGLAVAAGALGENDATAGTPAYMAPEQRAGKEVTARSDIFALGLVLYELFTGRKAFSASTPAELERVQSETTPTSPSSFVEGLDPAVERAILRCLRHDPRERPASAQQVAASLPGGDPLAAAIAAGETPSPQVVADAGETGALKPAIAWASFVAVLVTLVLAAAASSRRSAIPLIGVPKTPAALVERAHAIARALGHDDPAFHEKYWFDGDHALLEQLTKSDPSPGRWQKLAGLRPSAVSFVYRSSPRYMVPAHATGLQGVTDDDPPRIISGMVTMRLDPAGRLEFFEAIPPQRAPAEPAVSPEWGTLLSEAGLDPSDLKVVAPTENPLLTCDARAAWEAPFSADPSLTIRYEAGAHQGKVVYFETIPPWNKPWRMQVAHQSTIAKISYYAAFTLFVVLLAGGAMLARRNLRLGRGDRRGSLRLAISFLTTSLVAWALVPRHVPDIGEELWLFLMGASLFLFVAVIVWMLYIALEPSVRRMWPNVLISWNRLLMGRARDPLVGRDLLAGVAAGCTLTLLQALGPGLDSFLGFTAGPPDLNTWALNGGRMVAASLMTASTTSLFFPFVLLFFLVLFRMLLRRAWLAIAATSVVFGVLFSLGSGSFEPSDAVNSLTILLLVLLLTRFGLLALVAEEFAAYAISIAAPTSDLSAWYAPYGLCALAMVVVLAAYGFHASLGGRPLFGRALLDETP